MSPTTLVLLVAAATLAGCQQHSGEVTASGPCRLLSPSEIGAVLPGAGKGEKDDSREQYGISTCVWRTERGQLAAQYWKSEGGSAHDEAAGLAQGALDPLKSAARNNVRFESADLGVQAVAVIEPKDAQRGVLEDFAMLVIQRGNQILVLSAPELARSDRAKALDAFETLGKRALERL